MYRPRKSKQLNPNIASKNSGEVLDSSLSLEIKVSQLINPYLYSVSESLKTLKIKEPAYIRPSFFKDISKLKNKPRIPLTDNQKYFKIIAPSESSTLSDISFYAPSSHNPSVNMHKPKSMPQYLEVFKSHIKSDLIQTFQKSKFDLISDLNKIRNSSVPKVKLPKKLYRPKSSSQSFLKISHNPPKIMKNYGNRSMIIEKSNPTLVSTQGLRRSNRDLSLCSWATDQSDSKFKLPNISNNFLCP